MFIYFQQFISATNPTYLTFYTLLQYVLYYTISNLFVIKHTCLALLDLLCTISRAAC